MHKMISTLNIGLFINAVVKFTIIAIVLFMVVKGINSMKREAAKDPAPAGLTNKGDRCAGRSDRSRDRRGAGNRLCRGQPSE